MIVTTAPYIAGVMDIPSWSIWVPVEADEAVRLMTEYKKEVTRSWHTPTLVVYEQVGTHTCYIGFTRRPSDDEMKELREYLDHC